MAGRVLPTTTGFRTAIQLCNQVAEAHSDRFVPLLERVVDRLHLKGERPFNAKEEGQLQAMLGLEETELQQLTSLCIYTLQQAAFHNLTPQALGTELSDAGATATPTAAFQHTWAAGREQVVQRLRAKSFGATAQLERVDWRVQLHGVKGAPAAASPAEPTAVLELGVTQLGQGSQVTCELSKEQMYDLFGKLERIQEQLDALA